MKDPNDIIMKEEFDLAFKEVGGYYDISKYAMDNEVFDAFVRKHQDLIDWYCKIHNSWPIAYLCFVNNYSIGGHVSKFNNKYFIGINSATHAILQSLFSIMLSNKNILTDFGDVLDELEENQVKKIVIADLRKFIKVNGNIDHTPKDKLRQDLVCFLTSCCMKFLISHEYAHILFGHLDYLIHKNSITTFSNMPVNNLNGNIDPLDSQTLEMDSDCFAVKGIYDEILIAERSIESIYKIYQPFCKDLNTHLRLSMFAVNSMFRLFGNNLPDLAHLKTYSHPPALVRMFNINATLITLFESRTNIDEIINICSQTDMEVDNAFNEISKTKLDNILYEHAKNTCDYSYALMLHWNNVRPLLEGYTYGKLAPLHESNNGPSTL